MSFSKFILGVNKKACNAGMRGELGCFTVCLDILRNIVKYANRLKNCLISVF